MFFVKALCLGLHMFYSIAGSIVRWVSEGIILLKDWPAETAICKRFASLECFMQGVFYMAENFPCALYFGRYMFVKLQVWLHFYAEVRGLVNTFKGVLRSCCWSFAKCDNFTLISVERHFPLARPCVQGVNICLEAEPISIISPQFPLSKEGYRQHTNSPHV